MIKEHKLGRGKVGFTLHGEFAAPVSNLGILDLLHDGCVEERRLVA